MDDDTLFPLLGAILVGSFIAWVLGGTLIVLITFWYISVPLIVLGLAIWLWWPLVLWCLDALYIKLRGWWARLKLRGLRRLAASVMRNAAV